MGDNRGYVKRLGLVLFVSLSVQMSAVSAPLLHLHADAAHATDHHDGRVIHQHQAPHAQPATADHDHDTDEAEPAEASFLDAAPEAAPIAVGVTAVQRSLSGVSLGPPERVAVVPAPPRPLDAEVDVGPRRSTSPDLSTSSLRGPPR